MRASRLAAHEERTTHSPSVRVDAQTCPGSEQDALQPNVASSCLQGSADHHQATSLPLGVLELEEVAVAEASLKHRFRPMAQMARLETCLESANARLARR